MTATSKAERDRAGRTRSRPPSLRYTIAMLMAIAFLVGSFLAASALVGGEEPEGVPEAATVPAPTGPQLTVKLAAPETSGSAELGSFLAAPGDLWIGGRCSGGELQVHVDPVAVLPIPCDVLAGEPFLNQVILNRSTEVSVSVTAPDTITWELRVQQQD